MVSALVSEVIDSAPSTLVFSVLIQKNVKPGITDFKYSKLETKF